MDLIWKILKALRLAVRVIDDSELVYVECGRYLGAVVKVKSWHYEFGWGGNMIVSTNDKLYITIREYQ